MTGEVTTEQSAINPAFLEARLLLLSMASRPISKGKDQIALGAWQGSLWSTADTARVMGKSRRPGQGQS